MCPGTAPGSSAQNGPLCRLEREHVGGGASVGPQGAKPIWHIHPAAPAPRSVFPQPGCLSCPGPSTILSLPCSQRVPVNPGGHTHSPSWSWQTPPCRQPGHSLLQSCPQRPAPQPAGMRFQPPTPAHLTLTIEGRGSPRGPGRIHRKYPPATQPPLSSTTSALCS